MLKFWLEEYQCDRMCGGYINFNECICANREKYKTEEAIQSLALRGEKIEKVFFYNLLPWHKRLFKKRPPMP